MDQLKGDTEDTLRKLENFNWNRRNKRPTVTVIIDDDDTAHETVAEQSVVKTNTSYNQDSSSRQNESNTQSGGKQYPNFQTTKIGQANNDTRKLTLQNNKDLQKSLEILSHNLILILRKYVSVKQALYTCSDHNEYLQLKENIFTLSKSVVSNIIVPRHNDSDFVKMFLRRTIDISLCRYNFYISYLSMESLFWEMVNFANPQITPLPPTPPLPPPPSPPPPSNEAEKNQSDNVSPLEKFENITVSSFFNGPFPNEGWQPKELSTRTGKRQKTSQEAKENINERSENLIHATANTNFEIPSMNSGDPSWGCGGSLSYGKHCNWSSQCNLEQQAAVIGRPPPPYPVDLNEVAMSPVSLDGDNGTRQLGYTVGVEAPALNPSISFVTSLSPNRLQVADGYCRVCKMVTNRICVGCSQINTITYYCSQMCQEREWPTHMFYCWKSI